MNMNKENTCFTNYVLWKMFQHYSYVSSSDVQNVITWKYILNLLFFTTPLLIETLAIVSSIIGSQNLIYDVYALIQNVLEALGALMAIITVKTLAEQSNSIWKLINMIREDLFCTEYKKYVLQCSNNMYKRFTIIYASIIIFLWFSWMFSPLIIKDLPIKCANNEVIVYRNNIVNAFYNVIPFKTYNKFFLIFWLIETFALAHVFLNLFVFDIILTSCCWMLSANMEMISLKFKSLGYEKVIKSKSNSHSAIQNLKIVISQHMKIVSKIEKFYELIKPLAIILMGINSNIVIVATYLSVLNYMIEGNLFSFNLMKLILTAFFHILRLYIICHSFGNLDDQKNAMTFAMYSSNWTNKDIKFKKSLLMAMNMNEANFIVMRVTPTQYLNFEMFSRVMNLSYSIVSV
ncbi:uncharacterized protein LOC126894158 isoform X2 [Daktulosphaira vitifoliae]|nr:uncharacterized protein LOC126894158 isoform X2 [Daktulosphaira vitifoliae]